MGRMKQYMMEQWESQEVVEPTELEVGFLCPTCGHPAAAWVHFPGDEEEYSAEVSCLNPDTEDHYWSVSMSRSNDEYTATLDGHPDIHVSVKALDMSDDWDEPLPEPGAFGIFMDAMEEWRSNVDAIAQPQGDSSRNRMLFSILYSIVEAYFSDTIVGAAIADTSVQRQMLKLDALKDKQVSLETILDQPDIVREMVKATVQGLSFHNLPLVNGICHRAFGASILPQDKEDRALVVASVNKRHDCVHRNGVAKDGTKHVDITDDYLRKIGTLFDGMAVALEDAMSDAKVRKFLEDFGPATADKP
ncbi:hypothetical protein [Rhizobium terrae]|uniref:hypothetical protein n=1 Tax=Rhizobium terrae TaxID=2171756 RepID=UPI0013C2F853|nr:hypothetical protein [Rhizobium terrae]